MTQPPQIRAILPTPSLDDVAALHQAVSGGELVRHDDSYGWLVRDGHELWHLAVVDDLDVAANSAAVYVFDDDPDAVRARVVAAGHDAGEVRDEPWGMREFSVRDGGGNLLRVGRNR